MFSVKYIRHLDLLDITWSGLLTPNEMVAYASECRNCWVRECFRAGYGLRIHLRDDQPLPQDTLQVLESAFRGFPKAGRIAMITGSAVARLQIKRAMMVPKMRIFSQPEDALAWLTSP